MLNVKQNSKQNFPLFFLNLFIHVFFANWNKLKNNTLHIHLLFYYWTVTVVTSYKNKNKKHLRTLNMGFKKAYKLTWNPFGNDIIMYIFNKFPTIFLEGCVDIGLFYIQFCFNWLPLAFRGVRKYFNHILRTSLLPVKGHRIKSI